MNTGISLTDRAARHVKAYLAGDTNNIGLRIAVKPTGCSGYQYVVEAAEKVADHDRVFESNNIKIVVDQQSLQYLAGTELDYIREGLNEGFRFNNPNVQETCGCGESFTISEQVTE
ncbi:MAG: iron-sulfur cluster assembly accessory protein [Proteobacteria bacterium]|nr:iron-sulfur cluster assembly accessory protein [Pseudomonadota bacterium]